MRPLPHGSQQSDVAAQPVWKNGMQPVSATQTPVASGFACWHTSPMPHTGGGASTLPPHGPPGPETHAHGDPGRDGSQVAPPGQTPPHVPAASPPQGRPQRADGPGQHVAVPAGSRQMHTCRHVPARQRSAVHPIPSSQSASLVQPPIGKVVVVVVGATAQRGLQISFGLRQGWSGPHGSSLHWRSTVMKQRPAGGGQIAVGPGQQAGAPVGSTQMQACSHRPAMQ